MAGFMPGQQSQVELAKRSGRILAMVAVVLNLSPAFQHWVGMSFRPSPARDDICGFESSETRTPG